MYLIARVKGTQAVINLPANGYEFSLSWNANDDTYASLLADEFNRKLREALERRYQHAYEEGWKHAKAKEAKRSWWPSWLDVK